MPREGPGEGMGQACRRVYDDPPKSTYGRYPRQMLPWVLLLVAGLLEIGWAVGLKYSHGFTRPGPSAATLAAMALSMVLLGLAVRSLPIGTAYAVWTGIGAIGTAALGIILFGESAAPMRLVSIGLIVAGIVGLKLSSYE